MSYRDSAKNRKVKRMLLKAINLIKFGWLNLNNPQKLVLFWVVIWIISLFLTWVDSVWSFIVWSVFNDVLWITWYLFVLLYLILLALIFSSRNYLIIKNMLQISIKDWFLVVLLSIFNLLLTINSAYIISWLSVFKEWIFFGKWIIFSIIWAIFCIIWWILIVRTKDKVGIFSGNISDENADLEEEKHIIDEKNNMKLPF